MPAPILPHGLDLLREVGMPEEAIDILTGSFGCTITAESLASWLRAAYVAGRKSARDPYVWHDVALLVDG